MDFSGIMEYISILVTVMIALSIITNIIVQLIKELIPVPTNYVVVAVALVLTLAAFLAAVEYFAIPLLWYYAVGAVVIGIFVAYIAMFGFDKFKQAWVSLQNRIM